MFYAQHIFDHKYLKLVQYIDGIVSSKIQYISFSYFFLHFLKASFFKDVLFRVKKKGMHEFFWFTIKLCLKVTKVILVNLFFTKFTCHRNLNRFKFLFEGNKLFDPQQHIIHKLFLVSVFMVKQFNYISTLSRNIFALFFISF